MALPPFWRDNRIGAAFVGSLLIHLCILFSGAINPHVPAVSPEVRRLSVHAFPPVAKKADPSHGLSTVKNTRAESETPINTEATVSATHSLANTNNHASVVRYFSNRLLDHPAVPASGPDPERFLKNKKLPLYAIRLRLFVDATGNIDKIDLIDPEFAPPEEIEPIKAMFMATRFIPGRVQRTTLPSYMDIEVDVSDYVLGLPSIPPTN